MRPRESNLNRKDGTGRGILSNVCARSFPSARRYEADAPWIKAVLFAAVRTNAVDVLLHLINIGVPFDQVDEDGNTVLHAALAVPNRQTALVIKERLQRTGKYKYVADMKNHDAKTPFELVTSFEHAPCLQMITGEGKPCPHRR